MPEETALTVQNPASLEGAGFGGGYVLKPSRLELLQPIRAVELGVKPGVFRDSDSGEVYESVQFVPLRVSFGRVYWPDGSGLNSSPLCRSRDGITPVIGPNLVAQAQVCAKCRHSDWSQYRVNGKKPLCQERGNMFGIVTENKMPFFIGAGGMSLKPLKNFYNTVIKLYHIAKEKGVVLNIYDFTGEMVPKKVQNAKGFTYYELQFNNVGRIKNTDADFGVFYNQYIKQNQRAGDEDAIEGETETVSDSDAEPDGL